MVNHTTDKITNLTTYDLKFCFREVCCCCLLESRACSRCVFVVGTNMQLEMRPRGLGVTNLALTNTMLSSEKNMITEAHNHTVRARSALHDLDQATGRSSFKNKFALSCFPQIRRVCPFFQLKCLTHENRSSSQIRGVNQSYKRIYEFVAIRFKTNCTMLAFFTLHDMSDLNREHLIRIFFRTMHHHEMMEHVGDRPIS